MMQVRREGFEWTHRPTNRISPSLLRAQLTAVMHRPQVLERLHLPEPFKLRLSRALGHLRLPCRWRLRKRCAY